MRQRIAWQLPEQIYRTTIKQGRAALFRMVIRLAILSVGVGALTVLVIRYAFPGLPPRFYRLMWQVVLISPAFWAFLYFFQLAMWWVGARYPQARTTYAVSRQGVSWSDSARPWSSFVAFNIEPHSEHLESRRVVFFGRKGTHGKLTLPEDHRSDLIIRFVAKHLPLLEELPDPESAVRQAVPPPVWIRWLVGAINVFYGLALGYFLKGHVSKDVIELLFWAVFLINPATLAGVIGEWTGWLRRERVTVLGWWVILSILSQLLFVIGIFLAP